ncbi:triphosphoribosyl-dephospho-CoA synthase CitG [Weissella minor]|uniref:Probable 2-(5''-triphosphoribosyl)-3'-dephosphocoenzyme-A synthase n=1 Tax=Weissella minor TaxID=1620 RepID=A0A0R2JRI1_9LACO|nr:triphosphoribosyl-dephospho-CoA synthase CitG [Weissella minor]KRN76836.1 triphosphoribosyl-dephospho-CoA synthase [Weissella minor]
MGQVDLVQVAQKALLYEVTVNPKPGLVDPQSQGAHTDMDVFTFIDSSVSLLPYFQEAVQLGETFNDKGDLTQLFDVLRLAGQQAENDMFNATNGVNTHKGAIFSLGILVCATAYLQAQSIPVTTDQLRMTVQAMLVGMSDHDFAKIKQKPVDQLTAGERQFLKYGATGIRGQAEAGFPIVMTLAVPFYQKTSGPLNERLLDTLMMLSSETEDSNLIKRAGSLDILPWWKEQVAQYFKLGGSQTAEGMDFLRKLDEICIAKNLSLGGSADLLILTIFVANVLTK